MTKSKRHKKRIQYEILRRGLQDQNPFPQFQEFPAGIRGAHGLGLTNQGFAGELAPPPPYDPRSLLLKPRIVVNPVIHPGPGSMTFAGQYNTVRGIQELQEIPRITEIPRNTETRIASLSRMPSPTGQTYPLTKANEEFEEAHKTLQAQDAPN